MRPVDLTDAPPDLKPVVSAIPLDKQDPVTRQLRASLLARASGDGLQPACSLSPAQATALFTLRKNVEDPGKRAFDPDLDDGTGPAGAK